MTQITIGDQGRKGDGLDKAASLVGQAVAFLAEEAVPVVFPSYDQMSLPKKLAVTLAATLIPAALGTSAAVIIQHKGIGQRQRQRQGQRR